jgi:GNAT superfamily N-acetyltransferase
VEVESLDGIADLRRAYLASLAAPLDGMWESFASAGRHLEIRAAGARAGYLSLDDKGRVLQFHAARPFERIASDLVAAAAARDDVVGAMVSTADPGFLGPCLDLHRSLRVHTLLYEDAGSGERDLPDDHAARLDIAEIDDLDAVASFQRDSLDRDPGAWLVGYLEGLIGRRELHVLRLDGAIVATGEARVSDRQPPVVDLGVITGRAHRRRGIAAGVLGRLKATCRERGLSPICSTTVENVGARQAIANAGFVCRHRLLEIGF